MKPDFMHPENETEGIGERLEEPSYVASSVGNVAAFDTLYPCRLQAFITVVH
jgi:hypothetical protein